MNRRVAIPRFYMTDSKKINKEKHSDDNGHKEMAERKIRDK